MRIRLQIIIFLLAGLASAAWTSNPVIRPNLQRVFPSLAADTMVRINIVMLEQYPVHELFDKYKALEGTPKRNAVINELKSFSASHKQDLLDYLGSEKERGSVTAIRTLWIANIINCYVKPHIIHELAGRADIQSLDLDPEQQIIDFQPVLSSLQSHSNMETAWNVARVNAPQVWAQGYTGQNIVVSVIDSGVNYEHNDFGNMWEHPDFPNHGWNFVHGNNDPMDDHGHGTHVAGTIAGNGSSGSQTGVAPGASIMAIKALTATGSGTEFNVWSAIEFSVNYGAHIINLSLGWTIIHNPDRASWRTVMNNALAAGVIAAVAAGNEGNNLFTYPVPNNVRTPGDCPPPWLHPNQTLSGGVSSVVTVGATNTDDNLAGFSSMGPVSWGSIPGFNDYPFNPGMGLIRPDVVAPGVNIRSLAHFNNTDYVDGWQGTSMATPCVAGTMALLLSKNPSLTPALISQVLEETATSPFPFKNNQFGSGLIDAFAAFNAIPFPGPSYHSHAYYNSDQESVDSIFPGLSALLTLDLINTDSIAIDSVYVLLTNPSAYITMGDSMEYYGRFEPGEIRSREFAFSFLTSDTIPGGYMVRFEIKSHNANESWISTFTDVAFGPHPQTGEMLVIDTLGNQNGRLDPGETATIKVLNTNTGQWATPPSVAFISCASPYLIIDTESSQVGSIEPGDTIYSTFQVHVDPLTPVGSVLEFEYVLSAHPYLVREWYYQTVGLVIEDFESGTFSSFNWKHAGHKPWIVSSGNAFEGMYATHSGQLTHSQYSQLFIEATVAGNDSISFYRKVSSEEYFDFLNFRINDYVVGAWSGEKDWERVVFHLPPGPTTFRWEYRKDQSISAGEDKAWIDYIVFPGMLKVSAGGNAEICPGDSLQLEGEAMNHTSVLWNTTGTGYFSDSGILNPVYYPGLEDILNGGANLKLTAFGLNTYAIDEITLSIIPPTLAYAGQDTTSCEGMPVLLSSAETQFSDSVLWISSGTGEFDNPVLLHPTYYPGQEDVLAGSVQLSMIAYGLKQCSTDTSSITLLFIEPPFVYAGPDTALCMIYDYHAIHAIAENHDGVLWTTSGSGTFNNQTILHPVYAPSELDYERGFAKLTLHAAGIDACANASSSMILFFVPRAIAYAGPDITVCIGDPVAITSDSTAFSNRLVWTTTGNGFFSNDTIQHPVYYPGDEDYAAGIIQLVLTAYGHASCPPTFHSIFVNFIGVPPPPLRPMGVDSVDVYTDSVSFFNIMGVYLALGYNWLLTPQEAGTLAANLLEAQVTWAQDYNGIATISVQALNDCGEGLFSPEKTVQVYSSTGIGEKEKPRVHLSPLPAKDLLEIQLPDHAWSTLYVTISDIHGRQLYDEGFHSDRQGKVVINVSELAPGIYLLGLQNQSMRYHTKIVIAR